MATGKTIFVTGAAGYVGTMLVEECAARKDVARVIGLDKEPVPDLIKDEPKLVYLQTNTADEWEKEVERYQPEVVIHAAWQIREIYGNRALSWKWNITGSDKVFEFAFNNPFVKRLVYFSSVASYGSFHDNELEDRYTEDRCFRESEYLYAEEKRIAEEHLKERFSRRKNKDIDVSVLRPAAITGPRGRFMRMRFGLQSALAGQMKGSIWYRLISLLVSYVPVTPKWLRQFIHEDDVVGIVERVAFEHPVEGYEVFNICPPGDVVLGPDMAKAVGKKTIPVHPWLVGVAYFFFWHLTRGVIPTAPGAWRGYSYPIAVDGSKITKKLGYKYQHAGYDAFYYTDGKYESYVPEEMRRSRAKIAL
ncbi:MAG: NAD-dependent epimerase/dehydratase family protein [Patescibacteria group bacterium]